MELYARPHPFADFPHRVDPPPPPGLTIAELLGPGAKLNMHVACDGHTVPREAWDRFRPGADAVVIATVVPEGVDTAAYIALAAYAAGVSGTIAGIGTAALIGIVGSALVSVGISMAISMALNALIAPQTPGASFGSNLTPSRFSSISQASNRFARFEPLPRLYGTFRIHPPLAANYYSQISGDAQYFNILLFISYGRLRIGGHDVGGPDDAMINHETGVPSGTLRIGETTIGAYRGVKWQIGRADQITLFRRNVTEDSASVRLPVASEAGEGGWFDDGANATRTTEPNTVGVELDLGFNSLICAGKDGKEHRVQVQFKIQYRVAGATDWITEKATWEISGQTKQPIRRTYKFKADLAPEQYQVRITRVRTYVADREVLYADAYLTGLRSIKQEDESTKPWRLAKTATLMALRIKATGQLNGMVDSINLTAQSVLPRWTGSAWVDEPTNNPAWAFADAIRGQQLADPIPDSMIDLSGLQAWAAACDTEGLAYNWYHTGAETLLDRIKAIATTGRAAWALVDRKFGVVRDVPGTPIQMITPRNAKSLECVRSFVDLPHAVRVQYVDTVKWAQAERVVVDDGYAFDGLDAFGAATTAPEASKFEEIQTQGVTDPDQAWKEGRYFLAALRLRPETWTVKMDAENLVATRGDTVRLAYDTLAVGTGYGRVAEVAGDLIGLDETVTMLEGAAYVIRFRLGDLSQVLLSVTFAAGEQTAVTVPGAAAAGVEVGDLFIFGEASADSVEAIVKSVDYDEALNATVTLVPAAPGIHDAYGGTIPAYDPGVTRPVELLRPSPPAIVSAVVRPDLGAVDSDGVSSYTLALSWSAPAGDIPLGGFEVRWYDPTDLADPDNEVAEHITTVAGDLTAAAIPGIPPNTDIVAAVRSMSYWGRWSDWSAEVTVTGAGQKIPPAAGAFALTYSQALRGDGTVDSRLLFGWTAPTPLALVRGFDLLWRADDETAWHSSRLADDATAYTVAAIEGRTYSAQIRTVGPTALVGDWVVAEPRLVPAYTAAPAAPANVQAFGDWRMVRLTWTNPTAADLAGIEVWESATNNSAAATLLASVTGSAFNRTGLLGGVTRYFWLKAFNRSGNRSGFSAGVSAATVVETTAILDNLAGAITETQLSAALGGRITGMESGIYWLQHETGDAAARLVQETTDRIAHVGQETTDRVAAVAAEVADRIAAVTAEAATRTAADTAVEARIWWIEHETGNATGMIYDEQIIRQTADSNEVTSRQALSAKLTGLNDPSGATLAGLSSGLIYDERTLRETTDTSLATQISLLTAGVAGGFDPYLMWYFDSTVEGWTANGTTLTAAGGWIQWGTMTATGVVYLAADFTAFDGAQYGAIQARIKRVAGSGWTGKADYKLSGAGGFSTNYKTVATNPVPNVGDIATVSWDMSSLTSGGTDWATHNIVNIRLTLGASSSDKFDIDFIGVGRYAPGASTASLLAEQTARAAADSAEATSRQALSSKMTGLADPSGATLATLSAGLLYDERTARSTETTALASQYSALSATVATNTAAITTEQTARAAADSTEATSRQSLSTKLTGLADPAGATLGSLSSGLIYDERTTRSTETAALTSQYNSLNATLGGQSATISSLQTSLATTDTARAVAQFWLDAETGANSAQVMVQQQAIDGISASWTAKVDVNGYVAGFGLASEPVNGTPVSTFLARADRFAVTNGTNPRNAIAAGALTRSGITATLVWNGHGLQTGDRIETRGFNVPAGDISQAAPAGWNGVWKVTRLDANRVTWTVPNTLATPATGSADWTKVVAPFFVLTATDAAGNPPGVYVEAAYIAKASIDFGQVSDTLQSSNYNATTHVGWRLSKDGTISAQGITIYDAVGNVLLSSGGANWDYMANQPANLAALTGTEAIKNSLVSIGANGALAGAGGGQVTIGGLGFTGDLNATNGAPVGTLVGGTAAATVVANAANGQSAFSGTAKYRTAGAPTNAPSPTGITTTANANATLNIRLDWAAYTQGANQADFLLLFWRRDGNAPTVNDAAVSFNVNTAAASYYVLEGINPADTYSFAIAAARRTENGLEVGPIQAPTTAPDWRGVTSGTPNYTANVGGQSAATVATVTVNFNGRNDRDGTAITAPTIAGDGTAVDHTINTDGTANVSCEWSWGGTNADIDGFMVYVHQDTAATAYTFGTTPATEAVYFLAADKRAFILYGVPADRYYTFGVRAYRQVDPDIAASRLIQTAIVKPSLAAENPYRPASSVAFAGNVTGTVNGIAAASVNVWSAVTGSGKPADNATRNTIYRQATAPASGMAAGDFWIKTTTPYQVAEYNGSAWVVVGDITAQNTAAAILNQGGFATVSKLTAANISTFIAGAAIGTALIGNAAVDTLQIAGGAVNLIEYSAGFTDPTELPAAADGATATKNDSLTLTVSPVDLAVNKTVLLTGYVENYDATSGYITISVNKNGNPFGTILVTPQRDLVTIGGTAKSRTPFVLNVTDEATANATDTYSVDITLTNGVGTSQRWSVLPHFAGNIQVSTGRR